MSYLEKLRAQRKTNFDNLAEKLNKMSTTGFEDDDQRYWQPTVDKAGNGYAVIRFLPKPEGEEDAFVRLYTHAFKGPGGWYINNCLSTLNKADPVMEMNSKLWAEGEKSRGREVVTGSQNNPGTKRKLNFISNIYVVSDPGNPTNDGKVFLYKYGKKIFDKIFEARNPKFPDVEPFSAFDPEAGANFKLKIRRVEGYRNYDSSEWDLIEQGNVKVARGKFIDDDVKLEVILKSSYSLAELISPDKFKSYTELKMRLAVVMGDAPVHHGEEDVEVNLPDETIPWGGPKATGVATTSEDDEEAAFFERIKKRASV